MYIAESTVHIHQLWHRPFNYYCNNIYLQPEPLAVKRSYNSRLYKSEKRSIVIFKTDWDYEQAIKGDIIRFSERFKKDWIHRIGLVSMANLVLDVSLNLPLYHDAVWT